MLWQGCRLSFLAIVILALIKGCRTQAIQQAATPTVRPGRYVPELHGGLRGKYMPDPSGLYTHMHKPYDGGYGDRGPQYEQDVRGIVQRPAQPPKEQSGEPFSLGPRDHLRFMIDFNYNGSGWQIIQFDWIRDNDVEHQYNYVNENQLWDAGEAGNDAQPKDDENGYDYSYPAAEDSAVAQADPTQVHVDGEYDQDAYNVNYSNDNAQAAPDPDALKATLHEVLEYIQNTILPTLK